MAKFRYSLQNILNIKEKMETQTKQEFGMAQTALNVEIEHLERLKARKREYEEESGGLLQGKLNLRAIGENKEALLKMDSLWLRSASGWIKQKKMWRLPENEWQKP